MRNPHLLKLQNNETKTKIKYICGNKIYLNKFPQISLNKNRAFQYNMGINTFKVNNVMYVQKLLLLYEFTLSNSWFYKQFECIHA